VDAPAPDGASRGDSASYPRTELVGALASDSTGGVGALPALAKDYGVAMPESLINKLVKTQPPTIAEHTAGYLPAAVQEHVASYVRACHFSHVGGPS
jgi:hypothetical protein